MPRDSGKIEGRFFPLSSEKKEIGWDQFLRFLPTFLEHPRPTRRELPIIHRLTTQGAGEEPIPQDFELEAMARLLTDDHPAIETPGQVGRAVSSLMKEFPELIRHDPNFLCREQTVSVKTNRGQDLVSSVRFRVFMPRRGHYRQFGRRSIDDGPDEIIHAPHHKPLYTAQPDGSMDEQIFVGLTDHLSEVTAKLCETADTLITQAHTLEEKMKTMIFFQLLGVSLIHPFADGNGRSFGAKLVLDLNRAGISVRQLPALPELAPRLANNFIAGIGPIFLDQFMAEKGPGLFHGVEPVTTMLNDPKKRKDYMQALRTAIEHTIDEGIKDNSYIMPYVTAGVHALKLALSRDNFIPHEYYKTHIQKELDQTAAYRE